MLSRDESIELNLKNVFDYCVTLKDENHATFTTILDSEGVIVGKCY